MSKTYDSACEELAKHFLPNSYASKENRMSYTCDWAQAMRTSESRWAAIRDLASTIQQAIEDWLEDHPEAQQ